MRPRERVQRLIFECEETTLLVQYAVCAMFAGCRRELRLTQNTQSNLNKQKLGEP